MKLAYRILSFIALTTLLFATAALAMLPQDNPAQSPTIPSPPLEYTLAKPKPVVKMQRLGLWDAAITCTNGLRPSMKIYDHTAVIVTCDPRDVPGDKK
jgi:hypothetical protein